MDTSKRAVQSTSSIGEPLLEVRGLTAGYGGRAVIYDVDLKLHRGEVVVLLGSNGAGKTTTLKSIVGLVRPLAASARFDGMPWRMDRPWRAAQAGISFIPAERATFAALSVADNLALGSYTIRSPEDRERRMGQVLELFPRLGERLTQKAGTMSGGEQRMLSIGIALMAEPKLLLLDEPSLGLAPVIVEQIMTTIGELSARGMSVLMVEQNVGQAVRVADRTYVMRSGGMILEEPAAQTRARDDWWDLF